MAMACMHVDAHIYTDGYSITGTNNTIHNIPRVLIKVMHFVYAVDPLCKTPPK